MVHDNEGKNVLDRMSIITVAAMAYSAAAYADYDIRGGRLEDAQAMIAAAHYYLDHVRGRMMPDLEGIVHSVAVKINEVEALMPEGREVE